MASDSFEAKAIASSSCLDSAHHLFRAPRVSQIDCEDLDEGLVSILGEKVLRSLGNFRSSFPLDLKPEIALVLKLVIFRYGILDGSTQASPGAKLVNLKLASTATSDHRPSGRTLLVYLLLHPPIFPSYILTRLRENALSRQWPDLPPHDWRRKAWKAIIRVENAARAWELAGWGWFLWDGLYPSLLMRILDLRLVPSSPHLTRLVSYEFMNRKLVWGAFTEFMMFFVPLLPPLPTFFAPSALIAPLKAFLNQPTSIDYTSIPLLPASSEKSSKVSAAAHSGPLASLPKPTCPICHLRLSSAPVPLDSSTSSGSAINLPPIRSVFSTELPEDQSKEETRIFVPAQTDCWGGCRWCYYCIAGELTKHRDTLEARQKTSRPSEKRGEGEEKWSCLRCGGGVTRAWRVGAEVQESQPNGDTVAST